MVLGGWGWQNQTPGSWKRLLDSTKRIQKAEKAPKGVDLGCLLNSKELPKTRMARSSPIF